MLVMAFSEHYKIKGKLITFDSIIEKITITGKTYDRMSKEKMKAIIRDYIKIVLYSIFCGNRFDVNYCGKKNVCYFAIVRRKKTRIPWNWKTHNRAMIPSKAGMNYFKIGLFSDIPGRYLFSVYPKFKKILSQLIERYDNEYIYQEVDPTGWSNCGSG